VQRAGGRKPARDDVVVSEELIDRLSTGTTQHKNRRGRQLLLRQVTKIARHPKLRRPSPGRSRF